jgi:hypothetical protein
MPASQSSTASDPVTQALYSNSPDPVTQALHSNSSDPTSWWMISTTAAIMTWMQQNQLRTRNQNPSQMGSESVSSSTDPNPFPTDYDPSDMEDSYTILSEKDDE